ncbi:cytochrome P450 [Aspergillus stella-maris]|uniref:cytochrome P450 n=1 Tax=Aspergillus stella-maris TaxID=1810926 RepID=UPI003CCCD035
MSFVLDEEGNSKLPVDELQATFSVLTTAGSETSATALTGTLNYLIPVSIQAYTLNRTPKYFHNATTFAPQRWLISATTDPSSPYYNDARHAVQPFSMGLALLVWSFEFEAVMGEEVKWEELRTFLLIERKPVNVRLTLRAGG